ncbi:MAG: DNA-binding protein [Thermomicrobia bacterium]|nr:DNA-binding protein [Thermomicrobia bacterium]
MKTALLNREGQKTYAVIFDKGDEVIAGLQAFAQTHDVATYEIVGIGAFSDVVLGYFDRDRKDYTKIPLDEQVEVLSLVGNIARAGDKTKVHAHVVVGKADGSAWGGHILAAHVWPTLELLVTEAPAHLRRTQDPETGLALIDLRASETASTDS